MTFPRAPLAWIAGSAAVLSMPVAWGQATPTLSVCSTQSKAPLCGALRGERAEGWSLQTRPEVMARHGMVATSQPLAAQAGLQVLMRGGNAIDAASGRGGDTLHGFYRAGSDFRKDGEAVGW